MAFPWKPMQLQLKSITTLRIYHDHRIHEMAYRFVIGDCEWWDNCLDPFYKAVVIHLVLCLVLPCTADVIWTTGAQISFSFSPSLSLSFSFSLWHIFTPLMHSKVKSRIHLCIQYDRIECGEVLEATCELLQTFLFFIWKVAYSNCSQMFEWDFSNAFVNSPENREDENKMNKYDIFVLILVILWILFAIVHGSLDEHYLCAPNYNENQCKWACKCKCFHGNWRMPNKTIE